MSLHWMSSACSVLAFSASIHCWTESGFSKSFLDLEKGFQVDRKVLVKIFHAAKLHAGNHMSGEDNPHLEGGWPWRCASETGYEARLVKREITGAKGAFPRWPCKRVLAGREAPGALFL